MNLLEQSVLITEVEFRLLTCLIYDIRGEAGKDVTLNIAIVLMMHVIWIYARGSERGLL